MRKGSKIFRAVVPLGPNLTAELKISGGQPTPEHLRVLRAHLAILERALAHDAAEGELETEAIDPVVAGDIVQIRPSADPVLGGLMLRVTKCIDHQIKGYLLVPYRGGHAEMWHTFHQGEVRRIGRVKWQEAEWGFGKDAKSERRKMWIE